MKQADRDAAAARKKMVAHLRREHGVADTELEADLQRGENAAPQACPKPNPNLSDPHPNSNPNTTVAPTPPPPTPLPPKPPPSPP